MRLGLGLGLGVIQRTISGGGPSFVNWFKDWLAGTPESATPTSTPPAGNGAGWSTGTIFQFLVTTTPVSDARLVGRSIVAAPGSTKGIGIRGGDQAGYDRYQNVDIGGPDYPGYGVDEIIEVSCSYLVVQNSAFAGRTDSHQLIILGNRIDLGPDIGDVWQETGVLYLRIRNDEMSFTPQSVQVSGISPNLSQPRVNNWLFLDNFRIGPPVSLPEFIIGSALAEKYLASSEVGEPLVLSNGVSIGPLVGSWSSQSVADVSADPDFDGTLAWQVVSTDGGSNRYVVITIPGVTIGQQYRIKCKVKATVLEAGTQWGITSWAGLNTTPNNILSDLGLITVNDLYTATAETITLLFYPQRATGSGIGNTILIGDVSVRAE